MRADADSLTGDKPPCDLDFFAMQLKQGSSIAVTLFFDTHSLSMHFWMTALMSGLLGLMIFLVGTLDNPFRGRVSVGPDLLEMVYDQVMRR